LVRLPPLAELVFISFVASGNGMGKVRPWQQELGRICVAPRSRSGTASGEALSRSARNGVSAVCRWSLVRMTVQEQHNFGPRPQSDEGALVLGGQAWSEAWWLKEPPQYRSPRKTKKDDGRTADQDAELRHSNCNSEPSEGNRIIHLVC
jgi:hypothetical protein